MSFRSSSHDEAIQSLDDMRALVDQQEIEFRLLAADLQLSVIRMQQLLTMRKVTDEAAGDLRAAVTNLKHDLRGARQSLGEATHRLQELENSILQLEMDE